MKVICPSCGKLIDTPKTATTIFCNECGNNFTLEQGEEVLQKKYKMFQNAAYKACFHDCDYKKSIEYYKESLAIKPNDFSSITGIILCKLFDQSFDDNEFKNIVPFINSFDVYLNHENTFIYLSFLKDIIHQVEVFNEEGLNKLTNENKEFLNEKYLSYYLIGMKDALSALEELKGYIELCSEEEKSEFIENDNVIKTLDTTISFLKEHISKEYKVASEQSEIDNLKVIVIEETNANKLTTFYVSLGATAIVALIIITIINTTKASPLYYLFLLIPGVMLILTSLWYRKEFRNINKNKF